MSNLEMQARRERMAASSRLRQETLEVLKPHVEAIERHVETLHLEMPEKAKELTEIAAAVRKAHAFVNSLPHEEAGTQAEESEETRRHLIAALRHRVNNYLTPASMLASIIQFGPPKIADEHRKRLDAIVRLCNEMVKSLPPEEEASERDVKPDVNSNDVRHYVEHGKFPD